MSKKERRRKKHNVLWDPSIEFCKNDGFQKYFSFVNIENDNNVYDYNLNESTQQKF